MNCPPSKRARGAVLDLDPFDEDFTQDDLDEIDVIASQAITTVTRGEAGLREVSTATRGEAGFREVSTTTRGEAGLREVSTATRGEAGLREVSTATAATRQALDSRSHTVSAAGSDRLLEAQHVQLKRKLAEVQEDVLLKSGEVRVLRDSLRSAQQEAEAQRLRQVQAQTQQQLEQSLREKELLKKVQSLESQLQFKEAEVNDMRSKLLSDRRGSPLCRSSPRPQSSASPSGGFITKESFGAQVKTTPSSSNQTPVKGRRQEVTRADPFLTARALRTMPLKATPPGGVLLGILLQPLPQRLSLCHLLSLSPHSSLVGGGGVISAAGSALSPVQSLAVTGLNQLSLSRAPNSCPGAVLLLPLLRCHLAALCASSDLPACTSAAEAEADEVKGGVSLEECGLVALRTLTTLLQHSSEVVEAVLSDSVSQKAMLSDSVSQKAMLSDSVSQKAVLPCVLRLCKAPQTDVKCAALTTLRVLVQRSPGTHQDRLRCVLSEVVSCAAGDLRVKVVTSCVSVLTSITDLSDLTPLLCRHDPCVVLKLLQFVRSRSDPEATHSDWLLLDLRVVRLLSRLLTQSCTRPSASCPCHSQLVQCVVLILHRLWLDLRSQAPPTAAEAPPPVSCGRGRVLASLRETVLLFHWLVQNHSSFTESCRGVLHLYDQVVPALRDCLSHSAYCHELALEEICRSEPDDDMDTDSGS